MTYSPALLAHICAGIAAVVAGSMALVVRKGSALHRKSGVVFAVTMMVMSASGASIALVKSQPINVFAGVLTFYLVATAWLTVRRKEHETGRLEYALLFVALGAGITGWTLGLRATEHAYAMSYRVFGSIALLFATGDIRMLVRRGVSGARRLTRHLWRMGFALFIAAGSFFLGTAGDPVMRRSGLRARLFTPEIRATHLPQLPVLLIVALTVFWLFRVRFGSKYKTART
jgi:uncharacterized membrane protein